ncbi:hypothetical protein K5Y32_12845 [Pantoea sp. DY-15]|uniref:hypothetical protein n=1 Tax=Pantoea sp. DY-15 TaxID=2871489 RepID=UPI001C94F65D|nr:hypothetical protein [Pantoea sp. DY-15]MBY4888833.1 hypothetical protein [Pantoea sp. DY-15]
MTAINELTKYIPGAGAISDALDMASSASGAADSVNIVYGKASGNTEHHGNGLAITFNKNKTVSYWEL